ncbi:MAG: hypothetical protein KAH22_06695, partial [Thiotrichaceae bacterium]|nr:hypothetical protein [Thiotrichaceae bacterium]
LTISLLKDKVREVIKNDSTLENKVVTCKINELRNSGGYNIVSVGLRSNDNVIGSIDIKAEEVDSEIKVGKAFTI